MVIWRVFNDNFSIEIRVSQLVDIFPTWVGDDLKLFVIKRWVLNSQGLPNTGNQYANLSLVLYNIRTPSSSFFSFNAQIEPRML